MGWKLLKSSKSSSEICWGGWTRTSGDRSPSALSSLKQRIGPRQSPGVGRTQVGPYWLILTHLRAANRGSFRAGPIRCFKLDRALVDLTVAVGVGMVLALFLFMKKMGSITENGSQTLLEKWLSEREEIAPLEREKLPPRVEIYEITGPLFFGVADNLRNVFSNIEFRIEVSEL